MSDRAISAIGFLLGVAGGAVGITLSLRAIQNHRYPTPRKAKA
jgi:hypothetical protein